MIRYDITPSGLKYVQGKLKGAEDKVPRVIKNAINHTAKTARKELAAGVKASYTVKSGGFNSRMKIKNATMRNLSATIGVKGKTLTIGRFHTTAPKSGAKAEIVGKGLKPLALPLGERKTKSKGIAKTAKRALKFMKDPLRNLKKAGRGDKDKGKVARGFKRKGLIMQRETGARYPVKVLRSVSVPKMIEKVYKGERGVKGAMDPMIKKALHDEIESEIKKVI